MSLLGSALMVNNRITLSQPSFRLHRHRITTPIQFFPVIRNTQIKSVLNLTNKSHSFSYKIDEWVHEFAAEIVKNLRRAPLLVKVHDNGCERRLQTEEAVKEEWETVTKRWRDGGVLVPDGLMLVEEIGGNKDENEEDGRKSKVWGIVVQGKGIGSGPRCYLLKTYRVETGFGFGCTHFYLTRVRDFRESTLSQLSSCWLVS